MPIDSLDLHTPPRRPLRELSALGDIARLPAFWRRLDRVPRGSARVLVLPGFLTGDTATWALRRTLKLLGHRVDGWGLGINQGQVGSLLPRLVDKVKSMSERGDRVHLVGWSLGGYLAREVARTEPTRVAQVITMASPVVGGPKYTVAAHRYRARGVDLDELERRVKARNTVPLRVPVTALYSPHDAIVCPAACIDRVHDHVEHIALPLCHAGFGFNPEAHAIVARKLAASDRNGERRALPTAEQSNLE